MSDTNMTLTESIEDAAANSPSNDEASKSTNSEASESTEKVEEETKVDDVVIDPEIEEAVNFYRALKDPNQQIQIINDLAIRTGLIKPNQDLTPKQAKNFNELITEVLGAEYPDLTDKMSKLFEAFDNHHNEELNKVKTQLQQEKMQQQVETFESEFSNFIKEHKVTEAIAGKMLKEIEELPPTVGNNGKRIPLTTYLKKIHTLVTLNSNDRVVEDAVKRNEKIEKNLKDRSKNITSDVDDGRLRKGSALPSAREAIAAAAKGITFDE